MTEQRNSRRSVHGHGWRGSLGAGAILALTLGGLGRVAAQQPLGTPPPAAPPLFPPETAVVNYARDYTTVEQCLAAVARVQDSALSGEALRRRRNDQDATDPDHPELPAVVAEAPRCGARFKVAAAAAADLPLLFTLWLRAAEDSLAEAVLTRWLALAVPLEQALGQAIVIALDQARPARVALAERLLSGLERLGREGRAGEEVRLARFLAYHQLLQYASAVYDTTRADRYLQAMLTLADSVPLDKRIKGNGGTDPMFLTEEYQRMRALVRRAWEGSLRPMQLKACRPAPASPRPQGAGPPCLAPPIEAEFWFNRPDSTAPRPTRGRVGLVVFLEPGRTPEPERKFDHLRALHERFGEALEITLVTHTHGHLEKTVAVPDPAEEAKLLEEFWFARVKFPRAFALAVQASRFLHRPAPDGRRVQWSTSTEANYFRDTTVAGNHFRVGGIPHRDAAGRFFLVDRDGTVVFAGPLGQYHRLVMAVVEAVVAGARRSAPQP